MILYYAAESRMLLARIRLILHDVCAADARDEIAVFCRSGVRLREQASCAGATTVVASMLASDLAEVKS